MLKAIFASGPLREFGYKGGLPWPSISEDMKHFKRVTNNSYLVMGKKTHETLPPLPNRIPVIVLSDNSDYKYSAGDLLTTYSEVIPEALDVTSWEGRDVILIGGTSLLVPKYLKHCEEIYHTEVLESYEADTFIPEESIEYLESLRGEILLETEKCIIRKYT